MCLFIDFSCHRIIFWCCNAQYVKLHTKLNILPLKQVVFKGILDKYGVIKTLFIMILKFCFKNNFKKKRKEHLHFLEYKMFLFLIWK